uniref:Uncharacterized protein n=1 Tax=Anopheles christyi TaxID=43041 RepID=A0A182JV67_9DIPT
MIGFDVESSDLSSSDSEDLLDEIVIASARIDDPCHYDPLSSPIHYCDNNVHSDDNSNSNNNNNNTIIRIDSIEEAHGSGTSALPVGAVAVGGSGGTGAVSLNPSSAYKNSKSRRMEYSRRGMILGLSNPSQDSAFGSMTDGESSRASSFKLSSFASMNSPIDEGVEDLLAEQGQPASTADNLATTIANMKYIDSTGSSPCHDYLHHQQQQQHHLHSQSQVLPQSSGYTNGPCAVSSSRTEPSIASRDISPSRSRFLEPPKLVINNHSSSTTNSSLCYTLSPLRKCATTEVFSQKYRVSSFEDMSYNSTRKSIKNTSRKIFRSFEEERRIDSAFMPIETPRSQPSHGTAGQLQQQLSLPPTLAPPSTPSPKHAPSPVSPARKNHASYQNLHTIVPTARERGLQWRSNLIKSNECLFETSFNSVPAVHQQQQQLHLHHHQFRSVSSFSGCHPSEMDRMLRSHGSQDLPTTESGSIGEMSCDRFILTPEPLPPGSPSRTPSVTSTVMSSPSASLASTSRMRPNRTDRQQLFSLARFKHSTILDSVSIEDFSSEMSLRAGASGRSTSPASPCRSAASAASSSSTGEGGATLEYEAKPLSSDITCTSDASDTTSEDATSVSTTDTSLLKSPVPVQRTVVASANCCSSSPAGNHQPRHKHAPRDVRQYLDDAAGSDEFGSGNEEKTPLLDGMELSPISPTESEQIL